MYLTEFRISAGGERGGNIMINLPRNTCQWQLGLTETFRNASRSLFKGFGFKGYGTNLQNPSDRLCRLYIPDDGKCFIQADCAGAEALIVAYLCPDGNFRELFKQGIKPHVFVAMHLFADFWEEEMRKRYPEFSMSFFIKDYLDAPVKSLKTLPYWKQLEKMIKKDGTRYFIGKKSCHSFNYRKRPESFIFDVLKESEGKVVLSLQEGKRIHSIYHRLFPELEQIWHREIDRTIKETKTLFNLFGHPREFYGPVTDKLLREATAFVPQSTVGCITNYAFVKLQNLIEDKHLDWDLLNNKHDSILIQCPEADKDEAAKVLKESLEIAMVSPRGESFKMRSEVAIGYNWGKYSEEHNPKGMKEI